MKRSINDRVNPSGKCPINPVLRWETGRALDTICVESGLVPASDNLDNQIDYSDPFAVWGDNCDPNMLDEPLSDKEWAKLLEVVFTA